MSENGKIGVWCTLRPNTCIYSGVVGILRYQQGSDDTVSTIIIIHGGIYSKLFIAVHILSSLWITGNIIAYI